MRLLHIAQDEPNERLWSPPFLEALKEFGQLEVVKGGATLRDEAAAARIRGCDVLLTGWGARAVPETLASDPGAMKYICHVTGQMRGTIPLALMEAGIPVTNWGDAPADGIAEGAMALLLAMVKNLHLRIRRVEEGGWQPQEGEFTGTLRGLRVGIYGCGVIGRRFVELLRPFGAQIAVFDPFLEATPEGCRRVDDADALFRGADAIVIHAGLTAQTRGSVNARRLAMLPEHGIVINAARGGIVDQPALFAELEKGRLLAGLDVLEPDEPLPANHAARRWPNAIFTAHTIGAAQVWGRPGNALARMHEICLENLRRFRDGEELRFRMDPARYQRST